MSDTAFKTAAYPAYSTAELREWLRRPTSDMSEEKAIRITREIERRAKRDAGDWSVMTDGERLRQTATIVSAFKPEGR